MPDSTSNEEFNRQFESAVIRGQQEPKAVSAKFNQRQGQIVVDLDSGITFMFPVELVEGLADAKPNDLAHVIVNPGGMSLYWESLDLDFSVTGLLAGIFGSKSWMAKVYSELGKKGGKSKSLAKAQAARMNGKLGGRPKAKAQ